MGLQDLCTQNAHLIFHGLKKGNKPNPSHCLDDTELSSPLFLDFTFYSIARGLYKYSQ